MRRSSGLLLHFTSLPSRFGIGDLGPAAYDFVDFLAASGQKYWQVLPITPTSDSAGYSPYSGFSAFAANPLLISPEIMVEFGLLSEEELEGYSITESSRVTFTEAEKLKKKILRKAFDYIADNLLNDDGFNSFIWENAHWINDFAMFSALKTSFNGMEWTKWPQEIRDRTSDGLKYWGERLSCEVLYEKFCQWVFFRQWGQLRKHLDNAGVELIGDVPIYVTHDSSDVWSNRHLFKLDDVGNPYCVAGVPPDYFSETGQLWGNPVYNWQASENEGFGWWISRLKHNLGLYNWIRLDHFRGFSAYWEIPSGSESAIEGYWVEAPGHRLFEKLGGEIGKMRIIAEDLGHITDDVIHLRDRFNFPGMSILQFSFGENIAECSDALHNHRQNLVVYSGTHDNNTNRGWFRTGLDSLSRKNFLSYIGRHWIDESEVSWELIRLCMSSVGVLCIFQAQDLLSLDESARMNIPGKAKGNWGWKLTSSQLSTMLSEKLKEMTRLFGRSTG